MEILNVTPGLRICLYAVEIKQVEELLHPLPFLYSTTGDVENTVRGGSEKESFSPIHRTIRRKWDFPVDLLPSYAVRSFKPESP